MRELILHSAELAAKCISKKWLSEKSLNVHHHLHKKQRKSSARHRRLGSTLNPFLFSLSLSACRAYSSRRSKAKSEIGTMMAVQRGSLSRATAAYVRRAHTHMRGGKKRARCDVLALKGSHHKGGSENIMRRRRRVGLEAETEPPPTGEGRDAAASRCSRRPRPRYTFMLHTYFLAGDIFSPRDDTKGLRAASIYITVCSYTSSSAQAQRALILFLAYNVRRVQSLCAPTAGIIRLIAVAITSRTWV